MSSTRIPQGLTENQALVLPGPGPPQTPTKPLPSVGHFCPKEDNNITVMVTMSGVILSASPPYLLNYHNNITNNNGLDWVFHTCQAPFKSSTRIFLFNNCVGLSLVAQVVKNLRAMQETWVRSWVGKIPWRRKWQPTPVFLPGESHGQRSLVGYSPWSHKKSVTTE